MRSVLSMAALSIVVLGAGCDPFARQSCCECCRQRDATSPMYTAVFVEPASVAGKDTIETENFAVRVIPFQHDRKRYQSDPLLARVEIRNKRDKLARLDATQSCLIDDEVGAFNLELVDRIIPAGSFVQLMAASASYITMNFTVSFLGMSDERPEPIVTQERRQRVMLRIKWIDGKREIVDATYVVKPAASNPS